MNKNKYVFLLLIFVSCSSIPSLDKGIYVESLQKSHTSKSGVVSTGHPLATKAGVQILSQGGNAMDAAVAAAYVLAVVEPSMSGIGGRAQILIYDPNSGYHGIDATTAAPSDYDFDSAPKKRYGYPSIGIPGVVKGLTKALTDFGTLSREIVMKSSIDYARDGHHLIYGEAMRQAYVNEQLNEFDGSRMHFLRPDGSPKKPGEWIVQDDLAKVLQAISDEGSDVFYKGWIAEKIVEDNKANGGVLSMQALAEYEAMESHIVEGNYRGYDIKGLWIPSYGAITIQALHILEEYAESKDLQSNRDWGEAIYNSIKSAYLDRRVQKSLEDANKFTSKEYAKEKVRQVINPQVEIDKLMPYAFTLPNGHTTHLTVVDKNGMIVALTQTVGTTMGSKVATPGLGFVYAQTLGGYLGEVKAKDRASSHISPMIVSKDNEPILALGAAGGSRIPSSIVAVISRIIDNGKSLEEAMSLPRVHPQNDGTIDLEFTDKNSFTMDDSLYYANKGYTVSIQKEKARFGRIHAVMKSGESWIGVADPDWEGNASSPGQQ